jgi:predicted branched-subunit amino acid permease
MDLFDVDRGALRRYLAGDCLAILLFLVAGELEHGLNPLALPVHFVGVAVPFYVGWAVAAPALGAYAGAVRTSRRALLGRAIAAWFVADVLGQALRGTALFPGDADPAFFAVAFLVGGGALLVWRTVRFTLSRG